jgi:hypothetical protein
MAEIFLILLNIHVEFHERIQKNSALFRSIQINVSIVIQNNSDVFRRIQKNDSICMVDVYIITTFSQIKKYLAKFRSL